MSLMKTEEQITVQSVMQRQPVTIFDTDTIEQAVDKMLENHVSALPVVTADQVLLGVFTVNNLLQLVRQAEQSIESGLFSQGGTRLVADVVREKLCTDDVANSMSAEPITGRQDDLMVDIAKLMIQHQIHHIPITNDSKKLLGIVSAIDFVRLAIP